MNERIFYIERDEELSDLSEKIKETNSEEIIFVIPKKATIFLSGVNFQMLRNIAEQYSKKFIVVTRDTAAKKMLESVGVMVYSTLEDMEETPFSKIIIPQKNSLRIIPIDKILSDDSVSCINSHYASEHWKDFFSRPSRHALFTLLFLSLGLFSFIATFSLPSATIYIEPVKQQRSISLNVTFFSKEAFSDQDIFTQGNAVFSFPMEAIFEDSFQYSNVSRDFRGDLATGFITIYNRGVDEKIFRPGTRLQSQEGIIFRTKEWLRVPPSENGLNGRVVALVEADVYDAFGEFSGDRANLPKNQTFSLPGLSEVSQRNIWGQNDNPILGGTMSWVPQITESDIANAKKRMEEELETRALQKLYSLVEQKNKTEGTDLMLLPNGKQVEFELLEIVVDDDLVGQEQETFLISGKARIRNFAYSHSSLLEILKVWFERDISDDMELLRIDEKVTPDILTIDEKGNRIKANFSVVGVEQYFISPTTSKGVKFIQDIKYNTAGKIKNEAEMYISNLKEVADVKIELWPLWSKSLPSLPEKIEFSLFPDSDTPSI